MILVLLALRPLDVPFLTPPPLPPRARSYPFILPVEAPSSPSGWVVVDIPLRALARMRKDFRDLWVLNANGQSVDFVVYRPTSPLPLNRTPASVREVSGQGLRRSFVLALPPTESALRLRFPADEAYVARVRLFYPPASTKPLLEEVVYRFPELPARTLPDSQEEIALPLIAREIRVEVQQTYPTDRFVLGKPEILFYSRLRVESDYIALFLRRWSAVPQEGGVRLVFDLQQDSTTRARWLEVFLPADVGDFFAPIRLYRMERLDEEGPPQPRLLLEGALLRWKGVPTARFALLLPRTPLTEELRVEIDFPDRNISPHLFHFRLRKTREQLFLRATEPGYYYVLFGTTQSLRRESPIRDRPPTHEAIPATTNPFFENPSYEPPRLREQRIPLLPILLASVLLLLALFAVLWWRRTHA